MIYLVHGVRTQDITVEVEAETEEEAIFSASEARPRDIEVWDSETSFYKAEPTD
jgi:hypothetical protein